VTHWRRTWRVETCSDWQVNEFEIPKRKVPVAKFLVLVKGASMKMFFVPCTIVLLLNTQFAMAQQLEPGKYTGTASNSRNSSVLELEIISVSESQVNGKLVRYPRNKRQGGSGCAGTFDVEGSHRDGTLTLRVVERGGAAGDCGGRLVLKAEGNKLTGTLGDMQAELSK
jgi:hypothetical protein